MCLRGERRALLVAKTERGLMHCALSSGEISRYYATRMPKLVQRGRWWRGACPVHSGKGDSFSVAPETGRYRCFKCGANGDVVDLEMRLAGARFPQARNSVFGTIGRPVPQTRERSPEETYLWIEQQQRAQRDQRDADHWLHAVNTYGEAALEVMASDDPAREHISRLLSDLRQHFGQHLTEYQAWRVRNPELSAGLVAAGKASEDRIQSMLARFVMAGKTDAA